MKQGFDIFETDKGEGEGVCMSTAAFGDREEMFHHRDLVYAAEMSRLNGDPVYTQEELDAQIEALFNA